MKEFLFNNLKLFLDHMTSSRERLGSRVSAGSTNLLVWWLLLALVSCECKTITGNTNKINDNILKTL